MAVPSDYLSSLFSRKKERQEIIEVRRTILDRFLYIFSWVGLPAVILGAIRSYSQGRWETAIIYVALYLLFLLTTRPSFKLSFRIKALILIASLFLVALTSMVMVGLSGSGIQLMLGVCFLSALLFGQRGVMLALLVTLVSLGVLAIGMTTGFIDIPPERMMTSGSPMSWLTTICVFFIIVSITVIGFQMFGRRIEESLDLLEQHRRELEAANEHLREASMIISKSRDVAFLWRTREGWPVEYVSDNVENVLGYTAEEFLTGRIGYSGVIHPEDLPRVTDEVIRYTSDPGREGFTHAPYRIITKQGEVRWVEDTTQLRRNDRGEITHYQGIVQDITERKLTEEALRQSEEKYRLIAENMADIIAILDMNLRFTYISPSIRRVRGFGVEEALEQTLDQIMTPESLKIAFAAFEEEMKLEAGGTGDPDRTRTMEVEEYRMDGSTIWVEVNLSFLRDENQKAVGILSVSREISERKRAEEALRKSEEYFRAITENASDIIFIVNRFGIITYASPSIERFIGFSPEELLGRSGFDLILPDDHPRASEDFGQALRTKGVVVPNSFRVRHKDGQERLLEGVGVNLLDNPAIAGFVMNVRDITDRRRSEEERRNLETKLRRAQKMEAIGLMAGGVAHDLNNMLSAFVSLPELILMDIPEENQKLRREIQMIMNSGQRTSAIVDDLLTVTRGVTMAREALNLNNVVQEYMGSPEFEKLRHAYPGIEVVTELADDLLPIKGSKVHLMKALMNLVSNASEAFRSSDSGVVSVSTQNRYVDAPLHGYENVNVGEYAVLIIKDTGRGISPEDLERIFEPFYTKKVMGRSGTGLGLSVVWNTVAGHDGYIHVNSDRGGTVFELYFPITRESVSEQERPLEVNQYKGRGEKVLVVDDELDQRIIAVNMLGKLGYQADAVSGGQEALEFLKEHEVDILLLDMVMPGMDGCETFSRIVQQKPGQRAVIASGFSLSDRVRKAQELGAGDYIRKPYSVEKLGLAIKTELERSR